MALALVIGLGSPASVGVLDGEGLAISAETEPPEAQDRPGALTPSTQLRLPAGGWFFLPAEREQSVRHGDVARYRLASAWLL